MRDEYDSIYRSLSETVHPTYAGEIKRHLEIDENGENISIVVFKEAPKETIEVVCHTTCSLLRSATDAISNFEEINLQKNHFQIK